MKYYLPLILLIFSCNQVVQKNRAVIQETLNSHAKSKSLTIKDYKVDDYQDGTDTLIVFVSGHYSNDESFNDTLRYAKTGDQVIISK